MARDPDRDGCALESLSRSEPLVGTASRVRRWLLVEQQGAWGRDALRESRIDPDAAERLGAIARANGVRVLLIRRSPAAEEDGPRSAFLVRSDRVHRWAERLEVADAAQLLSVDLAVLSSDSPPQVGEKVDGNISLVCTNGRHDPCCADFGRPVVRELRARGVDVWESSHVGGDRFAANVVSLPTGTYFGRVEPEAAARLLSDLDAGLLDLDRYRGRSCYPPTMQAAEIFVRRELGERRLDALHFVRADLSGPDSVVTLAHVDGRQITAVVARERAPAVALTCATWEESEPWHHRLVSLEIAAG